MRRSFPLMCASLVAAAGSTLLAMPRPVSAAWTGDPMVVHATTADCPQVAACGDGAFGAILVWQENTVGATGPLHARHLTGNGDVDPAWPAPAIVCATASNRSALGAVADRAGGAYAWWMDGAQIRLTHVDAAGAVTAGWPAGGRVVGAAFNANTRPSVLADGSGGVYVGWLQGAWLGAIEVAQFRAIHLGPDNTPAAGSPPNGLAIGMSEANSEFVSTATLGLAPDGGVWAGWGATVVDEYGWPSPGDWRLTRLTPALGAHPGWTLRGVSNGAFHGESLDPVDGLAVVTDMALVGIATDGADGAYLVTCRPNGQFGGTRLFRHGADGALVPGWPADGYAVSSWAFEPYVGMPWPAELSIRACADGHGGVWAGRPDVYDHATNYGLYHSDGTAGTTLSGSLAASWSRLEIAQDQSGRLFTANCVPVGPYGYYQPDASVSGRGPAGSWYETHPGVLAHWYGDEGIAPTEDGGYILAWSQVVERFGIVALRMGANGQVTGAPPASGVAGALRLRFVPGRGVTLRASFPSRGPVRAALLDVSGRVVAHGDLASVSGEREWTFDGSASLPSGLYFARVNGAGLLRSERVVVTR